MRLRVALGLLVLAARALAYEPADGDIAFQSSEGRQAVAVARATHSPIGHTGIIFIRDGKPWVLEAVGPVQYTPLPAWEARGVGGHYQIMRLRQPLSPEVMQKVRLAGEALLGRPYDFLFGWSDEAVYCSELVWKAYQRGAGISVGHLQTLRDFDLSDPAIAPLVRERFHGHEPPLDQPVISPAAVAASEDLVEVDRDHAVNVGSAVMH